ncbi:MAG: transposase, partial [Spirochaetaceae bacterium]|nr:transposase [Spirochaetaceae bacterium]
WYGAEVRRIGRFEPSSKMCHACGFVNSGITLADRAWDCPLCGESLDRDLNAAINILVFSKKPPADSGVARVEEGSAEPPMKRENLEGVAPKTRQTERTPRL